MKAIETPDKGFARADAEVGVGSAEAAKMLGLTLRSLYTYRSAGRITPDYLYRGRPRYLPSSLERWKQNGVTLLEAGQKVA